MLRATKARVALRHCHRRLLATAAKHIPEECDVVIVGGGPAGLALAAALGSSELVRQSLRVVLVEGSDLAKVSNWAPASEAFSNRVSSLTNESQSFLQSIGAWTHVDVSRTCPIEEMQVWDGISDARITFSASELGTGRADSRQMAHLTENLNLQRGLLRRLAEIPQVEIIDSAKVANITRDDREGGSWPLVHLENNTTLRARLLVGADGFNSPVRHHAKIDSFGWSYDTQAIVATMIHHPRGAFQAPNTTAYQRFLPTGPIAFLPLSATVSSLVWSTKPRLAAALLKSEPGVLACMINAAFRLPEVSIRYLHKFILAAHDTGSPVTLEQIRAEVLWREQSHAIDMYSAYASANTSTQVGVPLPDAESVPPVVTSLLPGTPASFPLRFNHTEAYIGEGPQAGRTVLVGDAAHTVHPLAGQGLNLGLGDVECLSRCISEAVLQGGDVGSYTSLLPYARERYFENHKRMSVMDKMHKLYSTSSPPVVWARSVGLEVLNEFDSVKAAIMMSAGAKGDGTDDARSSAWGWAASGVETLNTGIKTGRVVRDGVLGLVGNGLRGLLRSTGDNK